jgi:hypothetical protein
VTKRTDPVDWCDAPDLVDVKYDLYVMYLDTSRNLLYINSSDTDDHYQRLAESVCGESAERITGIQVYRTMAGITRLVPTNVGVVDSRSRARRFSMHVGGNVSEGFPRTEEVTKLQTNIFASGFESGRRVTIGASLKGRIWSYQVAKSLKHWADWCDSMGTKLLNVDCNIDSIIRSFIRPASLSERPPTVFLGAEWPWELLQNTTETIRLELNDSDWPIIDADLVLTAFNKAGPVPFDVVTPDWSVSCEARFDTKGITYVIHGDEPNVRIRKSVVTLSTFLQERGITFHLADDALVVHPGTLIKPDRSLPPFDSEKLVALSWEGTNLRKESQGARKAADSIQARMVKLLQSEATWRVILDDDGKGEIADLVAIAASDREIKFLLIHCKYSSADVPGARLEDLYEVCGQAQKSVRWGRDFSLMLDQLIRRQKKRSKGKGNGFARGNLEALHKLRDQCSSLVASFEIAIAQPGVSKAKVSAEQLHLLASTESYLLETHLAKFRVFTSV